MFDSRTWYRNHKGQKVWEEKKGNRNKDKDSVKSMNKGSATSADNDSVTSTDSYSNKSREMFSVKGRKEPLEHSRKRGVLLAKNDAEKAKAVGSDTSCLVNGTRDVDIRKTHFHPAPRVKYPRQIGGEFDRGSSGRGVGFDAMSI